MIFYNRLRLANLINDFLLSTVIIRRLIETLTYLNHRKLTRFVLQFFRTEQLSFDGIDTSYNHKHFKNKCMQLEEKNTRIQIGFYYIPRIKMDTTNIIFEKKQMLSQTCQAEITQQ